MSSVIVCGNLIIHVLQAWFNRLILVLGPPSFFIFSVVDRKQDEAKKNNTPPQKKGVEQEK